MSSSSGTMLNGVGLVHVVGACTGVGSALSPSCVMLA
jgi:hypothetical protein